MSDTRRMLAEMVDPLFAGMGAAAIVERDIARLEELGLPNLLVPEAKGGFGGSWLDALTVFRLAGYHALGIDLPKLIVKRAAVAGTKLSMAFARACQIAGALDAALALSIAYANERQQFGRPLGKFQAVQQSLASFACEAAAANCAAMGAAQALDRGNAEFEVAAAKLRANRAVEMGTSVAHQVHGAIGFTEEYALAPLTRRLWQWRSEYGNDAYLSARLGSKVIAQGAERFWPELSARTDHS